MLAIRHKFQHTHQPEGRCDVFIASYLSRRFVFQHTHQPEGRCDASSLVSRARASRFQHTHQPEGRCDPWEYAGYLPDIEFQHTHQPEGRCDPPRPITDPFYGCFNTRTSPKAGATPLAVEFVMVQPVFQHTHQPEGRCDVGATGAGAGSAMFQHTHQPEGRCDHQLLRCARIFLGFNTRTSPKAGATASDINTTRRIY